LERLERERLKQERLVRKEKAWREEETHRLAANAAYLRKGQIGG
jgi:hypothetical protein